jgi:hypothetical protein
VTAPKEIKPNSLGRWQVNCPAGKKALGGGVAATNTHIFTRILESAPGGAAATGWLASVYNDTDNASASFYAWVICAHVAS